MKVTAENLSMSFNDAGRTIQVFSGLNFSFESGTSVAIVGESGVGKSTLLYLLGALERPDTGKVLIGEQDMGVLSRTPSDVSSFRGKNIGFIFQFHHLLPEFSALENVSLPLFVQGSSQESARIRAEYLLERVGLSHRLEHRPGQLSGGEQQRVAIARAFAAKPGVVLADEPTGNLDQKTGGSVADLLLELQGQEDITLVVVTHSMELAKKMDSIFELTPTNLVKK